MRGGEAVIASVAGYHRSIWRTGADMISLCPTEDRLHIWLGGVRGWFVDAGCITGQDGR